MPCAGCEDVRMALKAVATSLVRKGMAKNIQVLCAFREVLGRLEVLQLDYTRNICICCQSLAHAMSGR